MRKLLLVATALVCVGIILYCGVRYSTSKPGNSTAGKTTGNPCAPGLLEAAQRGDSKLILALSERNCFSPLIVADQLCKALDAGNAIAAKAYVDSGVAVRVVDAAGNMALRCTMRVGDRANTETLLAQGADLDSVPAVDLAVQIPGPEFLRWILEKHPNVNREDGYPVVTAIKQGDREKVRLLLDAGRQLDLEKRFLFPTAMNSQDPEIVRMILDAGMDPNWKNEDGRTILVQAIRAFGSGAAADQMRMIRELLNAGANPDQGYALQEAVATKDPELVELLLDAGADVSVRKDSLYAWQFLQPMSGMTGVLNVFNEIFQSAPYGLYQKSKYCWAMMQYLKADCLKKRIGVLQRINEARGARGASIEVTVNEMLSRQSELAELQSSLQEWERLYKRNSDAATWFDGWQETLEILEAYIDVREAIEMGFAPEERAKLSRRHSFLQDKYHLETGINRLKRQILQMEEDIRIGEEAEKERESPDDQKAVYSRFMRIKKKGSAQQAIESARKELVVSEAKLAELLEKFAEESKR